LESRKTLLDIPLLAKSVWFELVSLIRAYTSLFFTLFLCAFKKETPKATQKF
jgi:hypothetical protein